MWIVEELESAIDVVDLVNKYVSLKKSGVNYKAVCPFPGHSEKTPSFMVSPSKQLAYCFGCHKWGWAVKFVMDIENCEFREAIEILSNFTGIQVNSNFDKEKYEAQKNIYSLYKSAVEYYKKAMQNYPEVKKYLMDRWLNSEIIEKFHFGYSDSGLELYNYLKTKWFDDNLIAESNIFVDVKNKKDKFINRIIFPIQNLRWDFVAFTARILGSWEPKYINSPASKYYDKSAILYWLFEAKTAITKKDFVIVTEWQMDTISLQAAWFFNTVAISGTALTEKHLGILKRLTKKIYLCFDGDSAWEKATKLSLELMKNKGFEVRIISLKKGSDPDEIIKSGWDFEEYIQSAITPIWYFIEKSNFDITSIEDKKKLLLELIDIVKSYSDNVEKDYYLKEIAELLDINKNIVYDTFNRTKFKVKLDKDINDTKYVITSEDLAIWYILINDKNKDIFNQNIIFKDILSKNFTDFLNNWQEVLPKLDLDTKEKYRWISLKIEESNKEKTIEKQENEIIQIAKSINKDIYKKEYSRLKTLMNSWDLNAFTKYSELVKKAKKYKIK